MGGFDNFHQEYNFLSSFILPLCFNPNIGVVQYARTRLWGEKNKRGYFFCIVAIMGRGGGYKNNCTQDSI